MASYAICIHGELRDSREAMEYIRSIFGDSICVWNKREPRWSSVQKYLIHVELCDSVGIMEFVRTNRAIHTSVSE